MNQVAMRVIALLALLLGFMAQFILDGQTFTHAVFGIACGVSAMVCGIASARRDPLHRWDRWAGRAMASSVAALCASCLVMLPSSYRFQQHFNEHKNGGSGWRKERHQLTSSIGGGPVATQVLDVKPQTFL